MQHDYNLENQTGQQFRQDLNNALGSIVTLNSGDAAPAATFPFMLWADTLNGKLWQRDAGNATWKIVGDLGADFLGHLSRAGGTLTGTLLLRADGTLSAPALSFAGDPNTGLHRPAADQVSLVAGGKEFLRADFAAFLQFLGTDGVLVPVGTTAQRPAGAANGLLRYNSTTNKFEGFANATWKDVGGGGGGAGFQWRAISGTAPIQAEENGELVQRFSQGVGQELYAHLKIPNGYSPGSPIALYVSLYSPSSAGTVSMKAQATLVKKGVDPITTTTNQQTSTNTPVTSATPNLLVEIPLDVTDASGMVNGVAVGAGDVLKIRLYRDPTDTDAGDVRLIANATDVKFS